MRIIKKNQKIEYNFKKEILKPLKNQPTLADIVSLQVSTPKIS